MQIYTHRKIVAETDRDNPTKIWKELGKWTDKKTGRELKKIQQSYN